MKTKIIIVTFMLAIFGLVYGQSQKPWTVPDKYKKMANPIKSDDASLKSGRVLWMKHCQSCHGKTGAGDGTKAAKLETPLEDLSDPAVTKQSDGSLFYKVWEGRDDMPEFKKKIPDEDDIWHLVNYMRSFSK